MAFLSPYRVVDLTDQRGLLAGRILADLGADVVQVEPIDGSPARRAAPLDDAGRSLFWAAYAANKRGVACDLDDPRAQELLRRLCARAHFVLDSAQPGEMAARGLGYDELRRRNPALVHVSITAFGEDGPKAGYAAEDLTAWAAGGALYPNRQGDRAPLRIAVEQAFLHASADAAGGALIAHAARVRSGLGQHVDVSAQVSVAQSTLSMVLAATVSDEVDLTSPFHLRGGEPQLDLSGSGTATRRSKWAVADGLVELHLAMGPAAGGATNAFFAWVSEELAVEEELRTLDWREIPARVREGSLDLAVLARAREVTGQFLATKTKREVLDQALARKLALGPINTVADLNASPQLTARDYWMGGNGSGPRVPGRFAASDRAAFSFRRGAPELGAHTREVLGAELGLGDAEIDELFADGVVA